MVLKPAQLTPLSALALAQVLIEAGLPGVVNVVNDVQRGRATGPILDDPACAVVVHRLDGRGQTTGRRGGPPCAASLHGAGGKCPVPGLR